MTNDAHAHANAPAKDHVPPHELAEAILDAAAFAHIGVAVSYLRTGGLIENIYVNERAVEILGRSREELMARPALASVPEDERPKLVSFAEAHLRGEPVPSRFETVIEQANGRRVPISVGISSANIGGRPATVSFFTDITEQRAADERLRSSEARLRSLIEGAPDGIAIMREGVLLFLNPSAVRMLGYDDASEVLGQPFGAMLDDEDRAVMKERVATMLRTGTPMTPREYRMRRRGDGSFLTTEITSMPMEYEGAPAIIAFARDVTERVTMQAQLARADRLAALGTLAAGVAHEINNPLAFMSLGLEALRRTLRPDDPARDEALAMIEQVRRGVDRVAQIVTDLRVFSRADDGERGPVDVAAVVAAAERMASHEIRHRARFTSSLLGLPPVVGNERRLEQVFLNLLVNAAQALPEGRADNAIEVIGSWTDDRVVVEVIDNGPGVPKEALPHVFDPFFTTKEVGLGTGLGLSLCHSIVTQLGGDITLTSEEGRGARVRVSLPRATTTPAETPIAPGGGTTAPPVTPNRKPRVLVVDDEPALVQTLSRLLADDHDVTTTTSGEAALELLLGRASFDVVLCDLMMPDVSGMDVYLRVAAARPGDERRFVFMSGGSSSPRVAEFLATVTNARLAKPFSSADVSDAVRRATKG